MLFNSNVRIYLQEALVCLNKIIKVFCFNLMAIHLNHF